MVACYIALVTLLVTLISVSTPGTAAECDVSQAKIALHVTAPTTKISCGPSSLSCSQAQTDIVTQGELDQEYRVYVLLLNNNSASGIVEVRIGLDYDAAIGSGVDVLEFQPCAQSTTPVGEWPEPGSELRMSYLSCQALDNDLLVLGWFRVIAHTPGRLSLRDLGFGPTGTVPRLVNCDLEERLIHPQAVGEIALGGGMGSGFDPCSSFIDTFAGACCFADSCVGTNLACCWASQGAYLGAFTQCTSCVTQDIPKTWGRLKSRYE